MKKEINQPAKIVVAFSMLLLICFSAYSQKSALLWGTYFGGIDSPTVGNSVITDDLGNVYISGYTYNAYGIATSGAYQTSGDSVNGSAFLAKFDSSGRLLWSTYIDYNSFGEGLALDKSGNLYISGTTFSTKGLATSGAFKTKGDSIHGDAFLAKFTLSGRRIWATYFGGTYEENGFGVGVDNSNKIYLMGTTNSTSGIATSGTYQTLHGGGDDAFIAKFDSSGRRLWGTYFGGPNEDDVEGCALDSSGNAYLSGMTNSGYGMATSGAYQTSYGGGHDDAFLAKFDSSGNIHWATYYGGKGYNFGAEVSVNLFGDIYLTGYTEFSSGITTKGIYQTSYNGGSFGSAFLAKFSSSGNLDWATYYGGASIGCGVFASNSGDVYISGYTESASGVATSGAYKTIYNGGDEAYIAKFSSSGRLLYGTYYGIYGGIYAWEITSDKSGNVYITGDTYLSSSGIATSGAYQTSLMGVEDAILAKFTIKTFYNDAGITSIQNPAGNFCTDAQPVKVQLKNYGADTLKSVNINWEINKDTQAVYNWTGNLNSGSVTSLTIGTYNFIPGIDTIKVWTSPVGYFDTVPGNDTFFMVDTINALPNASFTYRQSADTIKFTPKNSTYPFYSWSFGDGGVSDSISPSHPYANGTYHVSLTVTDKNGCTATNKTSDTVDYTAILNPQADNPFFQIYPNPSQNTFTVHLNNKQEKAEILLYDVMGKQLTGFTLKDVQNFTLRASDYGVKQGVYILTIKSGRDMYIGKLIVE